MPSKEQFLPLERLLEQWGNPLPHESFDPEHAVSYRTWLAIADYVAYHEPRHLDALFLGVEFPDLSLDAGEASFPERVEQAMTSETRVKYAHLKLNPRHYGDIQTRLRLFCNLVQAQNDLGASFRVGRNNRVNPGLGALKLTFQHTGKGLVKILGLNPAKVLVSRVPEANRALNKFLDTRVIQHGPNFMDVRVEYLRAEDVSAEGDQYTLGTLTAGLEAISAYKYIEIVPLQTPLTEEQERIKAMVKERGVVYNLEQCRYNPDVPVFLYRYLFKEQAGVVRRISRALQDLTRIALPSSITKKELVEEEFSRKMLEQEREMDQQVKEKYEARIEAAEAKLALEQYVSRVNQVFGQSRTLAHDNKNNCLVVKAEIVKLLQEVLSSEEYRPAYKQTLLQGEHIREGLEHLLLDEIAPASWKRAGRSAREIFQRIEELVRNDELIMGGGLTMEMKEIACSSYLEPTIHSMRKVHPSIGITTLLPPDILTYGDSRLLKAAFTNLISNAVEASLPGGKVSITAEQKQRAQALYTIIEIYQSGALKPEIAERLNRGESFSTKATGHGIGATASYNIITGPHQGSIEYESLGEEGKEGGKVIVRLLGPTLPQLETMPPSVEEQSGERLQPQQQPPQPAPERVSYLFN